MRDVRAVGADLRPCFACKVRVRLPGLSYCGLCKSDKDKKRDHNKARDARAKR